MPDDDERYGVDDFEYFAQFMRDLREATMELLMQGLSMEEVMIK